MPFQPTSSSVHISRPLTNISVAWLQNQDMFIADKVIPSIPVEFQYDSYFVFDRGSFNRRSVQLRAPATEAATSGYTVTTASYSCKQRSLAKDIPDVVRKNTQNPLDADRNATQWLMQQMLLEKEYLFGQTYMTSSAWTNSVSGANTDTTDEAVYWDDYSSSDPIVDVRRAMTAQHELTGFRPNKMVLTQDVHDVLLDHPDILDRIKYSSSNNNPAMTSTGLLAQLFGVKNVYVSGAIQNTAAEGDTEANSFVMSACALLLYTPENPGIETPSAGYTFNWTGFSQGMNNLGVTVKRLREEKIESDRIEASMFFDMKLVSADLGYFFDNIIEE